MAAIARVFATSRGRFLMRATPCFGPTVRAARRQRAAARTSPPSYVDASQRERRRVVTASRFRAPRITRRERTPATAMRESFGIPPHL